MGVEGDLGTAGDRVEVHQRGATRHGRDEDDPAGGHGRPVAAVDARHHESERIPASGGQQRGDRAGHPGRCELGGIDPLDAQQRGAGRRRTPCCSDGSRCCSSSVAFQSSAEDPQSTGRPSTRRSPRSRSPATSTPGAAVNSTAASRQPLAHAGVAPDERRALAGRRNRAEADRAARPGAGGDNEAEVDLRVSAQGVLRGQLGDLSAQ